MYCIKIKKKSLKKYIKRPQPFKSVKNWKLLRVINLWILENEMPTWQRRLLRSRFCREMHISRNVRLNNRQLRVGALLLAVAISFILRTLRNIHGQRASASIFVRALFRLRYLELDERQWTDIPPSRCT